MESCNNDKILRLDKLMSNISAPLDICKLIMNYDFLVEGKFDRSLMFNKDIECIYSLPQNQILIEFCDEQIVICDQLGNIIRELDGKDHGLVYIKDNIVAINYSPDNVDTNTVDIWDSLTWTKLTSIQKPGSILEYIDIFRESSDKIWILTGIDNYYNSEISLYVYDSQSCTNVTNIPHNSPLLRLKILNPNKLLIINKFQESTFFDTIGVLDREKDQSPVLYEFNGDNHTYNNRIRLWSHEVINGQLIVSGCIFVPDSNTGQLFSKGYVAIFDLETMSRVKEIVLESRFQIGLCIDNSRFLYFTGEEAIALNLLTNEKEILGIANMKNRNDDYKYIKLLDDQICVFLDNQEVVIYDPVSNSLFRFQVADDIKNTWLQIGFNDKIAYAFGKEIKIYK